MNYADVGSAKVEEQQQQQQQQQQNLPDDSTVDSTTGSGLGKSLMNEDDLKVSYAIDSPVRWTSPSFVYYSMSVLSNILFTLYLCAF